MTLFFYIILVLNILPFLTKLKIKIKIKNFDKYVLMVLIAVSLLRFIPLFLGFFPASADMSFHTLTTNLIVKANQVPLTYDPILSVNFGGYPTGFHTLSAYISLLSNLPPYKSALFMGNFTYAFLLLSVFFLLKKFVNSWQALVASILTLFVANNPQFFISWGGNPFVLSLALIVFSSRFIMEITKYKLKDIILFGIFASASILTHVTPVYGFFYIYLPLFILNFLKDKKNNLSVIKKGSLAFLCIIILTLPFFINYQSMNISENEQIWQLQRNANKFLSWKGNITNFLFTIPSFFILIFGNNFIILSLMALYILINDKKLFRDIMIMILATTLVIINSRYNILPFSFLLLSERITTILLIPLSIAIGYLIKNIFSNFNKFKIFHKAGIVIISILFLIICIKNQIHYVNISDQFSMVTPNELEAFDWIIQNTPEDSYFLNNYGDAGLWIPALTLRKINLMQTPPLYLDEKEEFDKTVEPDYAYFGDKKVYETNLKLQDYESKYKKVYAKNNVVIFKIK
jgi:hypothetical protein